MPRRHHPIVLSKSRRRVALGYTSASIERTVKDRIESPVMGDEKEILSGLGPGKLFRGCTETEKLARIHDSRALLRKAMEGLGNIGRGREGVVTSEWTVHRERERD
jgi:hypothetical protein